MLWRVRFGRSSSALGVTTLRDQILPEGISGFVFPCSGSEANEVAVAMARRYTGREKILTWYRSYHGGTNVSVSATGDYRRLGQVQAPGFVKVWNPSPYFFEFAGVTESERAESYLSMLEEQIIAEGPHTIASIMIESGYH